MEHEFQDEREGKGWKESEGFKGKLGMKEGERIGKGGLE